MKTKKPSRKAIVKAAKRALRIASKLPATDIPYALRAELRKLADLIDSDSYISLTCILDLSGFQRGIELMDTGITVKKFNAVARNQEKRRAKK